jgi:hypothetical protein
MKRTPKRNSNPISNGLTLFFGCIAMVLMLIRLAVEGGSSGAVLVAFTAPVLIGLTGVGLVVAVRRIVISPDAQGMPVRACGRRS